MLYLSAKFQEKVTNGLRVTDGRTYGRMDEGDSKGPSTDGGETKNRKL